MYKRKQDQKGLIIILDQTTIQRLASWIEIGNFKLGAQTRFLIKNVYMFN
jgi:hypothetical protein